MRVLFISSFLLFADSRSGAAKRLFYFAQTLSRECKLSLVCLDAGSEADSFTSAQNPCERFLQIRYDRGFLDKMRDPFDVPSYLAPQMKREFETFVEASRFDVVFCAFAFALSLIALPSLAAARNVVYLEDDLSFAVFKERARTARELRRKLHMGIRWLQAERFYRRLMGRVRCFIAISVEEAEIVKRKFPGVAIKIVGYGIPMEDYPMLPPPAHPRALGFIGNYIHQSNHDAMSFFLEEWYPVLKRSASEATMQVAGKNLPESLTTKWTADQSVSFSDNVPDLAGFYSEIAIFVNPIVSQRGLRTKLVEAAAFGRPIISTTLGAEGLDDLKIQIADTPQAFVTAFRELQEPELYRKVADESRKAAEQLYSIDAVGRGLVASLREFGTT